MFNQDYYAGKGVNNDLYHNTEGVSGDFHLAKMISADDFKANYFKSTGNKHQEYYYKTVSINNENIYDAESNIFNKLELSSDSLF